MRIELALFDWCFCAKWCNNDTFVIVIDRIYDVWWNVGWICFSTINHDYDLSWDNRYSHVFGWFIIIIMFHHACFSWLTVVAVVCIPRGAPCAHPWRKNRRRNCGWFSWCSWLMLHSSAYRWGITHISSDLTLSNGKPERLEIWKINEDDYPFQMGWFYVIFSVWCELWREIYLENDWLASLIVDGLGVSHE